MHTLQFNFSELQIIPADVEELLGFEPGQSPEPFPELIDKALGMASGACHISGGYQLFSPVLVDPDRQTIQIEHQVFSPGKIVISRMKGVSQAAVFVATAGSGISELARQKSTEGDEMMAYVLDVTGSITVDKAAAKVIDCIMQEVSRQGIGITESFSPGYCDWSVAEQQKLFSLLPPGVCGITLSGSSLMYPIKSVSGLTGIGEGCTVKGYQCNWCPDKQCIYGKIRRSKKSKK